MSEPRLISSYLEVLASQLPASIVGAVSLCGPVFHKVSA